MKCNWGTQGVALAGMKGFGRLKDEYLRRSEERIQRIGTEINRIENQVPLLEKTAPRAECQDLLEDLKHGANALEGSVKEMGAARSENWEWALGIEDTEWLFRSLNERVRAVREILEESR